MKQYVVVGGSKGIGLGVVERLSQAGHQVTVLSRTSENLLNLANVIHVPWDAVQDTFPTDQIPETLHGLAYCPGSLTLKSFARLSPDAFREDFEINVIGAIKSIQGGLRNLQAAGDASVVLFSTVAVAQGMFAHASIAASKGAIEGLARTLASELAPKVRVNCIAPALTNTPLTEKFFSSEEKSKAMAEKYPMGRAGTVDDIAEATCYLLSSASGWITGQTLGVDGGMSTLRN